MGSGFSLICPHCHQRNIYSLGCGMQFYRENLMQGVGGKPPLLKSLISPSAWKQVELLRNQGWTIPDDLQYGYRLYLCPSCGRVQERFWFLLRKGGMVWEPKFRCGACHIGLIPYIRETYEGEEHFPVPQGITPGYLCEHCKQTFRAAELECQIFWD